MQIIFSSDIYLLLIPPLFLTFKNKIYSVNKPLQTMTQVVRRTSRQRNCFFCLLRGQSHHNLLIFSSRFSCSSVSSGYLENIDIYRKVTHLYFCISVFQYSNIKYNHYNSSIHSSVLLPKSFAVGLINLILNGSLRERSMMQHSECMPSFYVILMHPHIQ